MPEFWWLAPLLSPFLYALYLLVMAGVLRLCGVARHDVAAWALRQAGRQRFTDLIAAARTVRELSPSPPDGTSTDQSAENTS